MSGKRSDFQAQQIVFPVVGSGIAGTDTEGIHTEIRSRQAGQLQDTPRGESDNRDCP